MLSNLDTELIFEARNNLTLDVVDFFIRKRPIHGLVIDAIA